MEKVRILDFRYHDLRRALAAHLVVAGAALTTIKELIGHKALTMTLSYSHLAPCHKVKAVDILDNVLTSVQTGQKLHNFGM